VLKTVGQTTAATAATAAATATAATAAATAISERLWKMNMFICLVLLLFGDPIFLSYFGKLCLPKPPTGQQTPTQTPTQTTEARMSSLFIGQFFIFLFILSRFF
jgi:HD-like signal output (HDOD) protein